MLHQPADELGAGQCRDATAASPASGDCGDVAGGPRRRWRDACGCPTGFKRIRHYELLAPSAKAQRRATAQALLAMPPANPAAAEAVDEFMQRVTGIDITSCPHCASGRWVTIGCQAP